MGIFSRMSDIITANLNALLDRAENPETMLAQVIREMEESVTRARRSAAVAIAAQRRLEREAQHHHQQAEHWKGRAREALGADREELARRALARKQEHEALARGLDAQQIEATRTSEAARTTLRALEARLAEARRKERTLLSRHRTAQVRVEVQRHMRGGGSDFLASQDRFDRLADRLMRCADELVAEAELDDGLDTELAQLEQQRAVEEELATLKHEASRTDGAERR
jgi:phage shock protein A